MNNIIIKYRHHIPRLDDMLDKLHGATIFNKIDLRSDYHQIHMNEGDKWKTSFKMKFRLYEWLVMPFGLKNTPSTFIVLINHVLREFINRFVFIYFGDILVYIKTLEEREEQLSEQEWIGGGSREDQSDARMANTYQHYSSERFPWFSKILPAVCKGLYLDSRPANQSEKEEGTLYLGSCSRGSLYFEQSQSYESSIVSITDFNKPFEIECDASGIGIEGMLMQEDFDASKQVEYMKELHERTKAWLFNKGVSKAAKANQHRKEVLFKEGDSVWSFLRKERFPAKHISKLSPREDGLFRVKKKGGDNAYVLELPAEYGVSKVFNVDDLLPYEGEDLTNSRSNPFQEGEIDEGSSNIPTVPIIEGAITRSRAKGYNTS